MERPIRHAWEVEPRKNPDRVCGRCFYSIEGMPFKHKEYHKAGLKFKFICALCNNELKNIDKKQDKYFPDNITHDITNY